MSEKQYNIAVVGATGAVGTKILSYLEEEPFPINTVKLLSSKRSAGKKVNVLNREITIEEASETSFEGIDIAFFSAGGSISEALVPAATKAGAIVIDN